MPLIEHMFRRRPPTGYRVIAGAVVVAGLSVAPAPLASGLQQSLARPVTVSDLWLVPVFDPVPDAPFARAVTDLAEGRAARALPAFAAATGNAVLGGYARLYVGRTELALDHPDLAASAARELLRGAPAGYLREAAWWLLADAAEASAEWPEAVRALQALTAITSTHPARAHLRLGRAAVQVDDLDLARRSFTTVYYDFALTAEAVDAVRASASLGTGTLTAESTSRDLARAETLYAARRYAEARQAFAGVRTRTTGDDRSLVDLRLAECDFHLKRYPVARTAFSAHLAGSRPRAAEAEFFYFSTLRELDRDTEYLKLVRTFVDTHATDPLAEVALNDLGTYYIVTNEDERAAAVFLEMYRRFPRGAYADRAAWKAGWWAYKQRDVDTTIRLFESAAVGLRRADYRPAWLYWAARAREQRGDGPAALAGHRQVVADYRNSFYGRQATREIERLIAGGANTTAALTAAPPARTDPPWQIAAGVPPANARLIQRLLGVGLFDEAIFELRRIQSEHGTSPFLEATIGYALHRQGEWRPAITVLRRAYPQFMAAGGEGLPVDLLRMIFPLEYWDLIRKYAAAYQLDPYLMAALMCQESTFQADARSPANARGVMQILPSTGRRYAQRLGIRPFTTARLNESDVNIRIGMAYFADLRDRFGEPGDALAAYNAGENRLIRWRAERPGAAADEFIDDIPFPETQHYVKRVLGTAEDYRILYPSLAPLTLSMSGR